MVTFLTRQFSLKDKIRFLWRAVRYRFVLDPGEIQAITSRIHAGECVVDIGTHKGAYTWWMQKTVGPGGKVFCFEVQPLLIQYLESARSAFHWEHVDILGEGLSSQSGEMTLYVPEGGKTSPGASLEQGKKEASTSGTQVKVNTLDNFFAAKDHKVSLIKCDVEGHELEVFRGARRILERDHPVLLFECEGRHREQGIGEVFNYLGELGYTGYFIDGKHERKLSEFDAGIHQVEGRKPYLNNFLFIFKT